MSRYDDIDAILTALGGSATADEVEYALRDYPDRDVRAVLAERAAAGGGGGDPFNGGTITEPLEIDTHDAELAALTIQTHADAEPVTLQILAFNGLNLVFAINHLGEANLSPQESAGGGFAVDVLSSGPQFAVLKVTLDATPTFGVDADGAVYAASRIYAGGGVIFPTSDPEIVDAWWDNAGTLTKSTGP